MTLRAIVLSVSKGPDHNGLPVVVIKNTEDCIGVKHEEPMPGTPITIQSTRIRIIMMCTDSDDLVFFPETAVGRKVLLDRIELCPISMSRCRTAPQSDLKIVGAVTP